MNTNHYEINLAGEVDRVTTQRLRVIPGSAFYEALSRNHKQVLRRVMTTPSGALVGLRVSSAASFALWQLQVIPMNTNFTMDEEGGVYVPDFRGITGSVKLKLDWIPPMTVMLGFNFLADIEGIDVNKTWMCAFGPSGTQYRLPLANTFATGELCTGEFNRRHLTLDKAVAEVEKQFNHSTWNADLWDTITQTRLMFRWKPSKDKMEQQPIAAANWTNLCSKLAVKELEFIAP